MSATDGAPVRSWVRAYLLLALFRGCSSAVIEVGLKSSIPVGVAMVRRGLAVGFAGVLVVLGLWRGLTSGQTVVATLLLVPARALVVVLGGALAQQCWKPRRVVSE